MKLLTLLLLALSAVVSLQSSLRRPEQHLIGTIKTKGELQHILLKYGEAIIFFTADWCRPCSSIAPYLLRKAADSRVTLLRANVDQSAELNLLYGVRDVPEVIVVKDEPENVLIKKPASTQAIVDELVAVAAKNK